MIALNKSEFYNRLSDKRRDSADLKTCIEDTVSKLLNTVTKIEKPGMLLGKIQSGKTRAFIGIIGLAFDNGYDMAIVLTKGTRALAQQTYERLKNDFVDFLIEDKIQICDIMHLPANFTGYELKQKLIIVVKKETNNLTRIIKALVDTYPDLSHKKLLIIDDEADYASVGYKMSKEEGIVQANKIASQINELREKVASYDFLQVTATPYSLYLQPEEVEIASKEYRPIRPAFTTLLPAYAGYIGGEYYFEESQDASAVASHIFEEVPPEELNILRQQDRRKFKLEDALVSDAIRILRHSIVNFMVGACIRRIQQETSGEKLHKYSFIVHTEKARAAHSWQENIVSTLKTLLRGSIINNRNVLNELIKDSYDDISRSINMLDLELPDFQTTVEKVYATIQEDHIMITKVNSEKEVEELLDDRGQLRLRTPLNIFIGGQILDRGITVENLIGFYYGRRPNKFQQDTVLQHSRMYGNRPMEDLSVTRFYTARVIYDAMRRIHELDSALREAFERKAQEAGVVFIHTDPQNQIIPCSPNKILLSTTTVIRPYKRMLPIGFQTRTKSTIKIEIDKLDRLIFDYQHQNEDKEKPFLIDSPAARLIIDTILETLTFEQGFEWDIGAFKASMEYMSQNTNNDNMKAKVWCLARTDRNLSRTKADGSFSDAPDTPKTEGVIARKVAIDIPILMLFRQNGKEEQGWLGSPFWWPVLMAPKNMSTVILASHLIDVDSATN